MEKEVINRYKALEESCVTFLKLDSEIVFQLLPKINADYSIE